jgi:hypothetical protein
MESEKKYFTIDVKAPKSTDVYEGKLDKETLQPIGTPRPFKRILGKVVIPNFSEIWGVVKIDPKTNKPTGEYEALPYGDPKGTYIQLRYLRSAPKLLVRYQTEVLGLNPNKDGKDNAEADIELNVGINELEVSKNRLLVELLKNHYMNKSCKSRNPESTKIVFEEYDGSERLKNTTGRIAKRQEAEKYILDNADREDGLAVLASLFGMNAASEPDFLQDELLEKLTTPAGVDTFLQRIYEAKDAAQNLLLEAVEFKVIEGEEDKEIRVRGAQNKWEPLIKGHKKETDEDVVTYLLDRFFEAEVFDSFKVLEAAVDRQKEVVLN